MSVYNTYSAGETLERSLVHSFVYGVLTGVKVDSVI